VGKKSPGIRGGGGCEQKSEWLKDCSGRTKIGNVHVPEFTKRITKLLGHCRIYHVTSNFFQFNVNSKDICIKENHNGIQIIIVQIFQ